MKILKIQKQNNPLYPLPRDYVELSAEGQRQARVNACRQIWLKGLTRTEAVDALVGAVEFFDLYYLQPDQEANFDPLFYDDPPLVTPNMHRAILSQWATSKTSIAIMPRGSAKSTLARKVMIMKLLGRPAFSITYATSSIDNAKFTGQIVRSQLFTNKRVLEDFQPEYGSLEPKKGEAPAGLEYFVLGNGSWFRSISANSKQRGGRPKEYVLDDPEHDAKANTSMEVLKQDMRTLLFRVVLPMVMRGGASARWLATFVSPRHYAYHAMQTKRIMEKGREIVVAEDSRFDEWDRLFVDAIVETPNGPVSCWPEMWPLRDADKKGHPELEDKETLESIQRRLGTAAFLAEYRGRPGAADEVFFPPLSEEKHGYTLEQIDDLWDEDPTRSGTNLVWRRGDETSRISVANLLQKSGSFITVDTAFTQNASSDYKVATVMTVTEKNELVILDMFAGRPPQSTFVQEILRLAQKWRVWSIHPEVVKESYGLWQELEHVVRTRMGEAFGVNYVPLIKPYRPGQTQKVGKIAALHPRFEYGLIKMPMFRKYLKPWSDLIEQIEDFNPEAPDGGLQHDDHLDTVSMAQFVVRGRMMEGGPEGKVRKPVEEMLAEGELQDEDGNFVALGLGARELPLDYVGERLKPGSKDDGPKRSFA